MKPTVGRIVHFFNTALPTDANNHVGPGPYAAIVTQVFDGPFVNLKVLVPFGDDLHEGSVPEKSELHDARYWTWPPRDAPSLPTQPHPIGVHYGDRS